MKPKKPVPPEQTAALKKAIALIGGTMAVSRAFDIKPPSVSDWLSAGRAPTGRCLRLQELTNGKVTVHDLRPDVFGPKPKRTRR